MEKLLKTHFGNRSLGGKKDGAVIIATLCKFILFSLTCLIIFKKNCNKTL